MQGDHQSLEDIADPFDDVVGELHFVNSSLQPFGELAVGLDFLFEQQGHVGAYLVEFAQLLEAMADHNSFVGLLHGKFVATVLPGKIHVVEQMLQMFPLLFLPDCLLLCLQIVKSLEDLMRADNDLPDFDGYILLLDVH